MNNTAFFLFFLIVYAYFGYIVLAFFLSLIFNKKVAKGKVEPSVTLMIAAYNEEKDIRAKIENSLALDYPTNLLDIVVVSDASSDATDEIVRSFKDRGVRLIRVEGRVGKTQARNVAMEKVKTEIVLFSDATTEYESDVVKKLVSNFKDPEVGMVTGHLKYRDPGGNMGLGQKLFWAYESSIKKAQTKLGTLTGSVGCVTAFRREAYTPLPPEIIEDFTEPLMFILKGYRVVFEEEAVCYEAATQKSSQEWKMRVRVVRGGMAGLAHARGILNPFRFPLPSFQLISHKVLRWMVPVFAIALFVLSFLAVADGSSNLYIETLFVCQIAFYALVAWAFFAEKSEARIKFLLIPHYLFIVNAAALTAIFKTFTVPLETTWETERGI